MASPSKEKKKKRVAKPKAAGYELYTDGSFRRPNCGAWGSILYHGTEKIRVLAGHEWDTTISRMELTAILTGLAAMENGAAVTIYTDSQYAAFSVADWLEGWERRGWISATGAPVKNVDLMQALLVQKRRLKLTVRWIRGHGTDATNIHSVRNNEVDVIVQDLTRKMISGELKRTA